MYVIKYKANKGIFQFWLSGGSKRSNPWKWLAYKKDNHVGAWYKYMQSKSDIQFCNLFSKKFLSFDVPSILQTTATSS